MTWTKEQQGTADKAFTGTTLRIPLPSSPTIGNLVVAMVGWDKDNGPFTWTNDNGDPINEVIDIELAGGAAMSVAWKIVDNTTNDIAFIATATGAEKAAGIIHEWSTPASSGQPNASNSNTATAATVNTNSITTTEANCLLLAFASIDSKKGITPTFTNSFSLETFHEAAAASGPGATVGSRQVTATGSYDTTIDWGASDQTCAGIVAFVEAGAGGPTIFPPFRSRIQLY